MDDPYRQPTSADRDRLEERIRRAAAAGRITEADRDIRLGNVRSAQSVTELDLIGRDLDQLDGAWALPAGAAPAPGRGSGSTGKVVGIVFAVVALLAVVGIGLTAVLVFAGGDDRSAGSVDTLASPLPITPGAGEETAVDEPTAAAGSDEPVVDYALTGPGIRAFLAAYRAKFHTSRVVDLTLYDDYVVVQVPVPGRNRHSGWLFRPGEGWQDFGGVGADFPGSRPVDTRVIDVPALVRNIAKARRTLNVEDYSTTYVNIDHRPQFDDGPNVDVYVSNDFHESGYLATRPDGSVERSYPFSG
ncbi:DUF1707 domain-containing protein [Marmoricola sp. RAF53]|uniref:DUF1707 domain-containing protein n=1 Tax=Marmoricola sp. RAF53 TaxID=3233059 RepID=UPI003F99CA15